MAGWGAVTILVVQLLVLYPEYPKALSIGLKNQLPECSITCAQPKDLGAWFSTPTVGPLRTMYTDCSIKSRAQDGGYCQIPVRNIHNSSNCNETRTTFSKLSCTGGNKFRIVLTDDGDSQRCEAVIAFLHIEGCDVSVQNIGLYGKVVDLRVLYLTSCTSFDNFTDKVDVKSNRTKEASAQEENDLGTISGLHVESNRTKEASAQAENDLGTISGLHVESNQTKEAAAQAENDLENISGLQVESNQTNEAATQEEDNLETISGLQDIITLALSPRNGMTMSMPRFLYEYKWPELSELTLTNIGTTVSGLKALRSSMPRLQSLRLENSTTHVPVGFPWNHQHLHLPRNLSRTKTAHDGYITGFDLDLQAIPRRLRLVKNKLRDISLVRFSGRLDVILLVENGIRTVGKDTFYNVTGLQKLKLNNNRLIILPPGLFRSLSFLRSLDLCHNRIQILPAGVFQGLVRLQTLELNYNRIVSISSQVFSPLSKLNLLDLSHNHIEKTDRDAIGFNMPALQTVNLEHNHMTRFSEWMFTTWNLTEIKLSGNNLSFEALCRDLNDIDLQKVIHSNTKSGSYTEDRYKPVLDKTMDLSYNQFNHLNFSSLDDNSKLTFRGILNFFTLDLTGNDINCDCHTFEMFTFLKQEKSRRAISDYSDFRILPSNFDLWKCSRPESVKGIPIVKVKEDVFKCQKDLPECPHACACYEVTFNRAIQVNCTGRNLTELPVSLPDRTNVLLVSHNAIASLHNTPYLRSLQTLDLSHNQIEAITEEAVASLESVETVHLDNNWLRRLPAEFKQLRNVSLKLGGNKLICDCHSEWLVRWTWYYRKRILDVNDVICASGVPQSQVIYTADEEDFVCEYLREKVMAVAIAFGTVLPLVVAALVLAYKFRGEIKVFLFFRFNWHPFDHCDDQDVVDKLYDAFVSYNKADVSWVVKTLQPTLEVPSKPFRLCIHERDFRPGGLITDNVLYSVKYSRRMIMVLTKNFLKSEWCRLEFKSAHRRVLKDRSNYLIVILFDGINIDDLDEDMKLYLRTNTYIEADSKWFWERLHYALPQTPLAVMRGESYASGGYQTLFPNPMSVGLMQYKQNLRMLAKDPNAQVPSIVLDSEIM